MKIKEKVLKEMEHTIRFYPDKYPLFVKSSKKINLNSPVEDAIDLTLAERNKEVGKVIDEEFLKNMNDSGCSCGSFFNFIEGKFICNGCQEECENKFYEELKQKLGIK